MIQMYSSLEVFQMDAAAVQKYLTHLNNPEETITRLIL
jgi:hypothetical protein